jgi:hypothetical protein
VFPTVVAAAAQSRERESKELVLAEKLAALVPGATLTRTDPTPWIEYKTPGRSIESMKTQVSGAEHIVEFRYVDTPTLEALLRAYGDAVRHRTTPSNPTR